MPHLYRLKISLLEPHYPINELHRILEVRGNVNFYELHQAIFNAFDRYDEHLWKFIITRQKSDAFAKLYDCQEQIILPDDFLWEEQDDNLTLYKPNISLDSLNLQEKEYFYYWFDFGDDWVHRIRIEKITECDDNTPNITIIKKVGDSPKQYDDITDDDNLGVDESDLSPSNLDFEMSLVSALMLIASGGNGEPVRWQELVENGVADDLVKRDLIKPCVSPTHIVRMTAFGESELARFLEMTGILNQQ